MEGNARERGESTLVHAATNRMSEALSAWVDADFDRAASSAPMAVELLGKAVLWKVNPTLLVPLEVKQEAALVVLATEPTLESPSLRTIGLRIALGRLTRVFGDLPVPSKRQDRLVECRNGSVHVGTLPRSGENSAEVVARQVLADSLALCDFLLPHVSSSSEHFHGERVDLVAGLLQAQRTDVEHRVARLRTQASERLDRWREYFDDEEVWERAAAELEAGAEFEFAPEHFGSELGGLNQVCPVCGWSGRLLGRVDVDGDVDVEGGPDGPTYHGYWVLTFYPRLFACNVCKLMLTDAQQLAAAGLANTEREVSEADLGEEFDASAWAEWLYGDGD